jgi:endo-1,4-beta-xylanase
MYLSFRPALMVAILLVVLAVAGGSLLTTSRNFSEHTALALSATDDDRPHTNTQFSSHPVSLSPLESFDYADDAALRQEWQVATSGNATLSLERNDGREAPSLRLDTDLPCTACGCSEGRYVVASRSFDPPLNWTDAVSLTISARGDGLNEPPYGGQFSVIVWDNAGGSEEQWRSTRWLDRDAGWQTFTMTLAGAGQGNSWEHPNNFVIPSWETPQNGTLDLEHISRIGIEASTTVDDCAQHPTMSAWVDTIALIEHATTPTATPTPTPTTTPTIQPPDPESIPIGAAAATYWFGEAAYVDTLAREFDLLTTERQMQFDKVQEVPGTFTFTETDVLVQFATDNDMLVRGHALVWHQTLPAWLEVDQYVDFSVDISGECKDPAGYPLSREELMDILETHIKTVMGQYEGEIYAWDVVNEAITDSSYKISIGDPLRNTIWRCGIGDDYIKLAFQWAREADPNALLFYSEYGADTPDPKTDAVYDLVAELAEEDLIDGVGMHLHLKLHDDPDTDWDDTYVPTYDEVTTVMSRLEALGLIVHMSELDVHINADEQIDAPLAAPSGELYEQRLMEQAAVYREMARACRDAPACEAFITWGVSDAHTWLDNNNPDDPPAWPLLFDAQYNPKPAYDAVMEVLRPSTTPNPTATATPSATPTPTVTPPSDELNLTVSGIECSQAIQTTSNSVPMIADRPAICRVSVSVQNSPFSDGIEEVTARLYAARSGTELPDSPLAPFNAGGSITAQIAPDREQMNDMLNFQLPASWLTAGELTVWAEVNPERNITEGSYSDNRSSDLNLDFQDGPPLEVVIIPVAYQPNGTGPVYRPDLSGSNNYGLGMLQRIYPIDDIQYTIHAEYLFTGDFEVSGGKGQLLRELANLRARERPEDSGTSWASLMPKYYGVLPSEVGGGIAYRPGATGWGSIASDSVAAHEIGHNLGLMHIDCGDPRNPDPNYPYSDGAIGNVGVDSYLTQVRSSTEYKDFMSYCGPRWVSDYHYTRMFDVLTGAVQVQGPVTIEEAQDGLLIAGQISADGTSGSLQYATPLSTTSVVSAPGAGAYRIELRTPTDIVQYSYAFDPVEVVAYNPNSNGHSDEPQPFTFSFVIPSIANLGSAQLWKGDTLLATLEASAAAPDINSAEADGVDSESDTIEISWQNTQPDPEGNDVYASLRYSADAGQTWQTLAVDLLTNTYVISKSQLPASSNGIIELALNNTTRVSRTQLLIGEVDNKAPQVAIADADEVMLQRNAGEPLVLTAMAVDLEDGSIPREDVQWSSSLAGSLGTGRTLILPNGLEPGEHTITLNATDSDGAQSQDTITVTVADTTSDASVYLPLVLR